MSKEQLVTRLADFLREMLRKKDLQIGPEDNLMEKTGLDSMGAVEFIFKLEDEFNISIDDTEAEKIQTLSRAAELVLEKLGTQQSGGRPSPAVT